MLIVLKYIKLAYLKIFVTGVKRLKIKKIKKLNAIFFVNLVN